jgi:NADH-quinone oxidoreductase subunit F
MAEIVGRESRGEGDADDAERIRSLAASMQFSNCLHGSLSPTIINHTLQFFREEFDAHALAHRCPAKVCAGLIRYRAPPDRGRREATAISTEQSPRQQTVAVDDAKCIRCAACRDIAPADIVIEDRYADTVRCASSPHGGRPLRLTSTDQPGFEVIRLPIISACPQRYSRRS